MRPASSSLRSIRCRAPTSTGSWASSTARPRTSSRKRARRLHHKAAPTSCIHHRPCRRLRRGRNLSGRLPLSTRLSLTLACGDYEIIRPLKEGAVKPDGIDLTVLTGMDSTTRHWRFLRGREFDMAEASCSSFIVARDQGFVATAIPVFLHRRFRHGFVFINTGKGISKPTDLIGKRVGVKQFQATAIVWMRGILEQEYSVPQRSIEWVPELDETIDFEPPPGLTISKLSNNETV